MKKGESSTTEDTDENAKKATRLQGTLSFFNEYINASNNIQKTIEILENTKKYYDVISENLLNERISEFKRTNDQLLENKMTFLRTKRDDFDEYVNTVNKYGALIHNPKVTEPQIQKFFEDNPIVLDRNIDRLISKKSFGGEYFPDFVIVSNQQYTLVEIENAKDKLYTRKGDPTQKFVHGEQQVRDYLSWAHKEQDYLRRRDLANISVENTKGLLIIGMRENLTTGERQKLYNQAYSTRANYDIKTFDDILLENSRTVRMIKNRS